MNWLMDMPYWALVIMALALIAYGTWALWPDMSLRDEVRQMRTELEADNQKAWREINATHQALLDRADAIEAKLGQFLRDSPSPPPVV